MHIMYVMRTAQIDMRCVGSGLLLALYFGKIKLEDLTDAQIEEIRYTWNSRKYIPKEKWEGLDNKDVYHVKPQHMTGETQEEFSRRYVARMLEYLRDPDSIKWKQEEKEPSL